MGGGLTEKGSTKFINLAKVLTDGMVIYIPTEEELASGDAPPSFSSGNTEQSSGKININTAGLSKLATLPGIGESKAQSIIDYRREKGAFQSADELLNISGIGPKTLEKLRDKIEW